MVLSFVERGKIVGGAVLRGEIGIIVLDTLGYIGLELGLRLG